MTCIYVFICFLKVNILLYICFINFRLEAIESGLLKHWQLLQFYINYINKLGFVSVESLTQLLQIKLLQIKLEWGFIHGAR